MNWVIMVLAVLFLKGYNVGTPLAVCSLIEGILITIIALGKYVKDNF